MGGGDLTLYLVLWLAIHLKTAFLEVDASLEGASAIKQVRHSALQNESTSRAYNMEALITVERQR